MQQIHSISVSLYKSCCLSLKLVGIWCGKFVIKTSLVSLILNRLPILVRSLNKRRWCLILLNGGYFSRFWLMIGWSQRTFRLRIILVRLLVFVRVFIWVCISNRRVYSLRSAIVKARPTCQWLLILTTSWRLNFRNRIQIFIWNVFDGGTPAPTSRIMAHLRAVMSSAAAKTIRWLGLLLVGVRFATSTLILSHILEVNLIISASIFCFSTIYSNIELSPWISFLPLVPLHSICRWNRLWILWPIVVICCKKTACAFWTDTCLIGTIWLIRGCSSWLTTLH